MRRLLTKTSLRTVVLLVCLSFKTFSQHDKGRGNGTIISFGPAIGFYILNTQHAVNPQRRPSLSVGFRRELRVDREYRTFLQFGAEYFVHGLAYNSYYFDQDTLQLYDNTFGYRYELSVHEINIPIQLKILFNRGDNKLHSPYACVAYNVRYLLPAHLQVKQFGNDIKKDFPDMKFRNYLFYEKINAFVSAGLGWQRNKINNGGASFFAELNFRYGFSDYYFEKNYAPNSVFINGTHLLLSLGLKF